MTQDRKLRVGVIGANWSLVGHVPAWRNVPGVEILAVCTAHEASARAAAAAQNIPKAYWNYAEMVQDPELDIIDVGTRPSLRHDMVMRSLAAGKHVLNANPFATDLTRAHEMLAAQRRAGTVGVVEAQFPWVPHITRMKEMIEADYLGELYAVNVRCQFPLIRDGAAIYPFVTRPGYTDLYTWLGDPAAGANTLRNLGGHCLHALIYLFGPVQTVSAELAISVAEWRYKDGKTYTPGTFDTAQVTMRFRNGGIGHINTSWSVPDARGFSLEAFGSNGRLRVESQSAFPDATNTTLYAAPAADRSMIGQLEQPVEIPDRLFALDGVAIAQPLGARVVVPLTRMFGAMVAAIRHGGAEPTPSFAQACHVQAVCEAAEVSNRTGAREVLAG